MSCWLRHQWRWKWKSYLPGVGLDVFYLATTVIPKFSMRRASVQFVFAIVPLFAPWSESFSFDLCISFHGNLYSSCLLSSYAKKKQYFDLEHTYDTVAKLAVEASANDLLNNIAWVCWVMTDESYEIYRKLKVVVSLSSSVPDHCIQKTAASKGWLAQTNHLLHHGVSTLQY